MTENRRLYMHTIDGRPAQYYPDTGYICFSKTITRLETSLYAIRRQQHLVREKDAATGQALQFTYGYALIKVPK